MSARDRQDAVMGWLRSRGSATAEEIAAQFEVSLRTAHRDIAALRARDVPIDGETGPGGGLRLDPLRALPPVQLGLDEVVGVVLAGALAAGAGVPFGTAARRAVEKVMATLPPSRAAELRRALDRVVVGAPASPAVVATLGPVGDDVIATFEAGFTARRAIGFTYRDRNGAVSVRRAEPHGLMASPPAWYLLALDLDREVPRMFRLDRITEPTLLAETFSPEAHRVFGPLIEGVGAVRVDVAVRPSR